MNDQAVIEFNVKLPKLTLNQQKVLKVLIEIGKLVGKLYLKQENYKYQGSNFYPNDASRGEIEKAAQIDPKILSPYTIIERVKGKLKAIPYHVKYKNELTEISNKLIQASKITDNNGFKKFLRISAESLLNGDYKKIASTRLQMSPYILDFSIGPIFHHNDHLFFKKGSYGVWIGIIDKEGTERLNNYRNITLSMTRKGLNSKEKIDNYKKVRARVLDVILLSGLLERTKFVGIHIPINILLIEKYGSEITLFNQPNDLRVKEQILPIFESVFSNDFKEGFTAEDLRRGYLRGVALHELAHSYLYYRNAQDRLLDLFSVIDELTATLLGLRLAGILLLKDRINNKQLESMLITFLCRSYYHKTKSSSPSNPLHSYTLGGLIFINFMLENGAIKISNDKIVPNFMKIFVSLHELSEQLEVILAKGSYQEALKLVHKYT